MAFWGAMKAACIYFIGPLLLFILVIMAIALVQKKLGMKTGGIGKEHACATDDQMLRGEGLYPGSSKYLRQRPASSQQQGVTWTRGEMG